MQEIEFYCKKCRCSMHMSYIVTGNKEKQVMDGIVLKCRTCKKVSVMKKYTEGLFVAGADKLGKYYL